MTDLKAISTSSAEHYVWGERCDGWHLVNRDDLSIIQETVPPGAAEVRHYHDHARQFLFVLDGEATMHVADRTLTLRKEQGIEIPPGTIHKLINRSSSPVRFLVVSMPKSHGDRIVVEEPKQ